MPRVPELGFKTEGEFVEWETCRGRDEGPSGVDRKYLREGGKRTEVSGCFGYSLRGVLCMRTRVRDSSIKGQYKKYCFCQWKHSRGFPTGAPVIPPAVPWSRAFLVSLQGATHTSGGHQLWQSAPRFPGFHLTSYSLPSPNTHTHIYLNSYTHSPCPIRAMSTGKAEIEGCGSLIGLGGGKSLASEFGDRWWIKPVLPSLQSGTVVKYLPRILQPVN